MNIKEVSHNSEDFSAIISSINNCGEPLNAVDDIQKVITFLPLYGIECAENIFKHVMPLMAEATEQAYLKNDLIADKGDVADGMKANLMAVITLIDCSSYILDYIVNCGTVPFIHVSSVPINMGNIIFLTFQHCKIRQKIYLDNLNLVSEIMNLFRRTQEIHTKFLNVLDAHVIFNINKENEVTVIQQLLVITHKTGEMLSGVNMKAMIDNWKGYIMLLQKYSPKDGFNVSAPLTSLTQEIDSNLCSFKDCDPLDAKKLLQFVKVVGFLVKVAIKFLENINIREHFDEILRFCQVIHSCRAGNLKTNGCPDEIVEAIISALYMPLELFVNRLFHDNTFIKKLCHLDEEALLPTKMNFGLLHFINTFLRELPQIAENETLIGDDIVPLLDLSLGVTKNCYSEYFLDYNATFYEDLVINITVAVLLYPNNYSNIECVLLKCVIQKQIWTATLAADIWCLVLRYSSVNTCRSTLRTLINKILELNVGIFAPIPTTIHLKILAQRIFKILPSSVLNEEMSRYNPAHSLFAWKILNVRSIPLSHRYYIESILSSLYDQVDILPIDDHSVNDIILLMEKLSILSHTNFSALNVNASRLVALLTRLWSFNIDQLSLANTFYRYFVYKLTKITIAVINESVGDDVLTVLFQLKCLSREPLFQILCCEMLQTMAKRTFKNYQEQDNLFSLVSAILQILLTDANPVIVQISLETMHKIVEHNNYQNVISEILMLPLAKTAFSNLTLKCAAQAQYDCSYLEKGRDAVFYHHCLEWSNSQLPATKKIKIDNDVDELISILKNNVEKVALTASQKGLNEVHISNIKDVITKLTMLV